MKITYLLICVLLFTACGSSNSTRPKVITTDPSIIASTKCDTLEPSSWYQTKCYWDIAMVGKDFSLCDSLPESSAQIVINLKEEDSDYKYAQSVKEYAYKNNCKDSIHYLREGSEWNLKEGIPPFADPQILIYSGEAVLSGIIKYEPEFEGNDPVLFFYINTEDLKLIPPAFQKYQAFKLTNLSSAQPFELENANDGAQTTITVKEIELLMEGAPLFKIVDTKLEG